MVARGEELAGAWEGVLLDVDDLRSDCQFVFRLVRENGD